MTNPEVAILMLCMFIMLVLLGFPIAFTLIAMGVGFGYYAYYDGPPEIFSEILNTYRKNMVCQKVFQGFLFFLVRSSLGSFFLPKMPPLVRF